MAVKRVIEGIHVVPMGKANAFVIEGDDGSTLRLCPAINESIGRDFCLAGFPSEWQGDSIFV
jgi:hypothetical protein